MESKSLIDEPEHSICSSSSMSLLGSQTPRKSANRSICCPPRPHKRSQSRHRYELRKARSVTKHDYGKAMESEFYCKDSPMLYFRQCFFMIKEIGMGSYSTVFRAKSKVDGKWYAIKIINSEFSNKLDRKRKLREVRTHEFLPKHQNCVELYKAWEECGTLYMQLELCDTNLQAYAVKNPSIPENTIWVFLIDLLLGLKHLHDNELMHLNIKPENAFMDSKGVIKLGKFSLVVDAPKIGGRDDYEEGDFIYVAPEVLSDNFTKAADIFCLGITILELACNFSLPKSGELWHQLRENNIPDDLLKNLSPELTTIIKTMMHSNYKLRPTVDLVLEMDVVKPFFNKRLCELKEINRSTTCSELLEDKASMPCGLETFSSLSELPPKPSDFETENVSKSLPRLEEFHVNSSSLSDPISSSSVFHCEKRKRMDISLSDDSESEEPSSSLAAKVKRNLEKEF